MPHDETAHERRGGPWGALGAAALGLALIAPITAARADFDPLRGVLDSAGAAFAYGFDGAPPGREAVAWGEEGPAPAAALARRFDRGAAIEGERSLLIGGDVVAVHLDAGAWPAALVGRRVEIRMWVRAEGTDVEAQVWWTAGDGFRAFAGEGFHGAFLAQMSLFRSGRATDDGWFEMTTGPVDFAFGGRLAPDSLSIYDARFAADDTAFGSARAPDHRARVDGLEIIDLGPAAVPDAPCRLADAAEACGAHGICLRGRCVDGAAAIGPLLPPALRAAVIERRAFELLEFDGSRTVEARRAELLERFAALGAAESGHRFWSALQAIYTDSGDGHAAGPMPTFNLGASDICTAPGIADRFAGSPEHPLVYRLGANPIVDVMPGDAIITIDGMRPDDWLALTRPYLSVQGDPAAFAIDAGRSLIDLAALLGAELQVLRCPPAGGCGADEGQILRFDLSEASAELWADGGVERGNTTLCDYRLDALGLNGSSSVASRDEGPVRVLAINGVPGDSRRWMQQVGEALDDEPELVLLDQRLGFGGQSDAVAAIIERLFPAGFGSSYSSFPATDAWDVADARGHFEACLDAQGEPSLLDCGVAEQTHMTGSGSAPRRVAVLGGSVISGNEYLLRMLQARDGIRVFAPAPTIGGFGWVIDMPSLVGGLSGGRMQLVDTVFAHDGGRFGTGTGIPADVMTVYRQSDILAGRDTFVEAALEWLQAEEAR